MDVGGANLACIVHVLVAGYGESLSESRGAGIYDVYRSAEARPEIAIAGLPPPGRLLGGAEDTFGAIG